MLEDHRGSEGRFEAVRVVMLHDPAKGALRCAGRRRFRVVRKRVEEPLHLRRRSHAPEDAPLLPRKG